MEASRGPGRPPGSSEEPERRRRELLRLLLSLQVVNLTDLGSRWGIMRQGVDANYLRPWVELGLVEHPLGNYRLVKGVDKLEDLIRYIGYGVLPDLPIEEVLNSQYARELMASPIWATPRSQENASRLPFETDVIGLGRLIYDLHPDADYITRRIQELLACDPYLPLEESAKAYRGEALVQARIDSPIKLPSRGVPPAPGQLYGPLVDVMTSVEETARRVIHERRVVELRNALNELLHAVSKWKETTPEPDIQDHINLRGLLLGVLEKYGVGRSKLDKKSRPSTRE